MADNFKDLSDEAKEAARNLKNEAQEFGHNLKDNAVNVGKETANQVSGWYQCALEYVKEHPCTALGAAFLIGMLIAKSSSK